MWTQGSRLPKTSTETHRGCSPGTSHSLLRISPSAFRPPQPPQRRVLGAPSCPAAVTARSGDAWSSSRVRAGVRPSEAVAALRPRPGASGSPESGSGGTWETGAARGISFPPCAADRASSGVSSRLSRAWGRASRRARVGAAPVSSREGKSRSRCDPLPDPATAAAEVPTAGRGPGRRAEGRRAGAALFPASPEAPPHFAGSLPGARAGSSGAVRRGDGGGGRREGADRSRGQRRNTPAAPSPSSAPRLADPTGLRRSKRRRRAPSPGRRAPAAQAPRNGRIRSGGPRRGWSLPRPRKPPAAPGGCAAPPPHPVPALCRPLPERRPEGPLGAALRPSPEKPRE